MASNHNRWCFAWFQNPAVSEGGQSRAALAKNYKWKPHERILTISFLDGDPQVQKRVQKAAQGWLGPNLANVRFSFRENTTDTLIRISFRYPGSWSTIGTTCRQVPKGEPTMNFGWLEPDSPDDEVDQVVLHEFGHALGLIHEHQNPGGDIKWNRKAVMDDLHSDPDNWTDAEIEHNVFEAYSKRETNFTALDPKSIMMYPIPPGWTTDGFSVDLNTKLSDQDKRFIHQQYK